MKRSILLVFVMIFAASCGWSAKDWASKAHQTLKDELSPVVEMEIAEECAKRQIECKKKGLRLDGCPALQRCQEWAATYVTASKALHGGLGLMNQLLHDLDHLKKVKEGK